MAIIIKEQDRKFRRFVAGVAKDAARTSIGRADINEASYSRIYEQELLLKVEIERTTTIALRRLAMQYQELTETNLLRPMATTTVMERLSKVLKIRRGLYVGNRRELGEFPEEVVAPAIEGPYVSLLLKAEAYDWDIEKELPKEHITPNQDISDLIDNQLDGRQGFLSTETTNMFYTKGKLDIVAAYVYWHTSRRDEWILDVCQRNVHRRTRPAGTRIICPGRATIMPS